VCSPDALPIKGRLREFHECPDDWMRDCWQMSIAFLRLMRRITRMIQAENLSEEVTELIKRTSGKGVPYKLKKIRKNLFTLDGFKTLKARVIPYLDQAAKERRYAWYKAFCVSWESAKSGGTGGVQVVVMYMDEKRLYDCASRAHDKRIASIGILPKYYKVQHKSHIPKQMGLAATGFVVTNNHDMRSRGEAFKFKLHRAGRMCPAKKDSYKRVYREYGTFRYPKLPQNILRQQGELYFEDMNVSGSTIG
jgi:hypothetical protein